MIGVAIILTCVRCHINPQRPNHKYCLSCFAAYNRNWRKTHKLSTEARFRDTARSYAGVYKRRGKIEVAPCACGEESVEMHHPDHSRPLDVVFVCRPCHLAIHGMKPSFPAPRETKVSGADIL